MAKKALNNNFHNASKAKEDEFYTQLSDIERELKYYKKHFKNKVVYCNCDDPRVSNFFHYFSYNFEKLGLKKLIATCYKNQSMDLFSQNDKEQAIYLEYDGDKNGNFEPDPEEIGIKNLKGDGDFRSKECIELLKQSDIVVTNPPFSRIRDFIDHAFDIGVKRMVLVCPERLWACKKGLDQWNRHRPSLWVNLSWREDYLNKGGSPDRALAVAVWDSPHSDKCEYEIWGKPPRF